MRTSASETGAASSSTSSAVNATRIWKFAEMDADHATAWSKGGATTVDNCQMLCKTHNRAKGNR